MIKLYQWLLDDTQIDEINRHTNYGNHLCELHLKRYDSKAVKEIAPNYRHVATIDTNDLEEAFTLTNLWDKPERVTRHFSRLHSMSVGDLVVTNDGKVHYCDHFGFTEIGTEVLFTNQS